MGRYDGKTEKATPRKRAEARKEGQVARSQELPVAFSLLALLFVLWLILPVSIDAFSRASRAVFLASARAEIDSDVLGPVARGALVQTLGPVLAVAVVSAVVAGVAQVGFKITPRAARPKLSKISPKQGLERFRPSTALWDLGRTAVKVAVLVLVAWVPVQSVLVDLTGAVGVERGLLRINETVMALLVRAALAMVVVAAVDFAYQKHKHEKSMMMSKEDVKQENKNAQGDPLVKGERRKRAADLSRNRMLASIGEADVVVTNPTHFAVALKYTEADGAPRVLAKGTDEVARRIRDEARRHGVSVIEDRPLARALYRRVPVGGFVPADLYEAVAVVLAVVYRRRARVRARRRELAFATSGGR